MTILKNIECPDCHAHSCLVATKEKVEHEGEMYTRIVCTVCKVAFWLNIPPEEA